MLTVNTPEVLRHSLQASVDALYRRRACDIEESLIEDYVKLDWLEWHGGGLRLTTVGENICRQELARLRELAPASRD
ncbi:hypothetical protein CDN99_21640 [Roseateles aquatilis]|uniref:Uncharacterized protein n=1 Tax=Roseateles aquatilis TaxID=431061 RepID=A0A246J0H1_9BURK|nr:hypothetical protein [Roseateles aquatilis]OWQ85684.1 hypothetical protein CDN99_21640 [Roseateles aquatilis]